MMRDFYSLRGFSVTMALVVGSGFFLAVSQVDPEVFDPGLELERELEQEERNAQRDRFEARQSPAQGVDKNNIVTPPDSESELCIDISAIEVDGVSDDLRAQVDSLANVLVPGCVSQTDISALMKAIDAAYAQQGFITTRTYIPKQNLMETGLLRLTVLEGNLESIVLQSPDGDLKDWRKNILLGTAFRKDVPGKFQLRDLEQAVDQLGRPQSAKAELKLEPGEAPGGSRVVIQRSVKDRVRGFLAYSNNGSASTGTQQVRLTTAIDGILSASDVLGVTYVGGVNSNALNLGFSAPWGYSTISSSFSYSDYLIPISTIAELFGQSKSYSLGVDRVVYRDANSKTNISATLVNRNSERAINGVALTPQTLTTLGIGMSRVVDTKKARWSFDLQPSFGLNALGAQIDEDLIDRKDPHAQSILVSGGMSFASKGSKWGKWSAGLRGQMTSVALYPSQQLAIGARSTTRGYEQSVFSADNGAYARFDAQFNLPELKDAGFRGFMNKHRKKIRPYAFADIGGGYAYSSLQSDWAAGFGGGLRVKVGEVSVNVSAEASLVDDGAYDPSKGHVIFRAELMRKMF